MVDKFWMKVTTNVAVSLVLIILYVYFFGQSSVHRYLKRAVYIIEEEEKYMQIPSPGTTATVTSLKSLRLRDLLTFGYLTRPYWAFLGLTWPYSAFLCLTGPYSALLGLSRPYSALLCLTRPYSALLGFPWPYWALLGLTWPY